MGVLDTVRTAVAPVLDAVEGVERQGDDTPGGGSVDETSVPSEVLYLSPVTGISLSDDVDEVDPDDTTVHDFGVVFNRTAGDAEEFLEGAEGAVDDFGAGVTGDGGDGALGALGRALRWAGENPFLVAGGLLVLYLAPLATNALGVLDGVVGDA
jgi:hypothetical protein